MSDKIPSPMTLSDQKGHNLFSNFFNSFGFWKPKETNENHFEK